MKEKNKDRNLIDVTDMLISIIGRHELVKKTKYGGKFERWEDFGLHILNIIYDWELEDLNDKFERNFPGIDLGNENGIGVQVTIDNTTKHINNSIKTYQEGYTVDGTNILPNKYPKLIFLFISTSHSITKKYSYSIENDGFEFENKNIITFSKLLSDIETKTPAKVKQIKEILEGFVFEFDDYLRDQLRKDNYKLATEVLKENIKEFNQDPLFQEIVKEFSFIPNKAFGVSTFTYDFENFSESYSFIIKNIERIRKKDLTKSESIKFYKSVSENSSYIMHFFSNLGKINDDTLDDININLISLVIQNNQTYQNFISIISYLDIHISSNNTNKVLKIFHNILEIAQEEFLFRKVAIIISNKPIKSFDTSLMLALVTMIVEKGYRLPHDFIVEFLSKNIDRFSAYELENIMSLFNFDGTLSEKLITINSSIREERYLPSIFSKMLYVDYNITFKYFGKLLKLFYENDKYSVSSRKLQQIKNINHIGYYSFPEVTLSSKRRRNDLQENIFILLGKELVKSGNISKKRKFFEEVVEYLIDNGDYSIFYELISFALVSNKDKNIDLIRKLVYKKEIYSFINIFQTRWGKDIFGYLFSKESVYIRDFEDHVINDTEVKAHEYHQAYLLSTIPKSNLSQESKDVLFAFQKNHKGYKISFRSKPSFEVTTWSGRQKDLVVKLEKKEKTEDLFKKSDLVLDSDKGWDLYDYKGIFEEYFKHNLDQIKDVYSYIAGKGEDAYILASMPIRGFLEYSKEKYKDSIDITFYNDLIDIYSVIEENDRHSKLEVGRLLDDNEFLRREFTGEILKIDENTYKGIKSIVIDLASNKEPDKDSENDGLTLGLNTVRGLGTIIAPILLHYYPNDADLKSKIIDLSNDKLYGIQSTLIANITWLLKDNRELLRSILSKYLYTRNKTIDHSIVNYCIGRLGYVENKDLYVGLLNGLLKSDDKDIQSKAGEHVGIVILSGLQNKNEESIKEYKVILDDIISKKHGTHDSILGVGFAIQNNIISLPEVLEKKIELINYILYNYEEPIGDEYSSLTYRLSFLFYKDNFLPEYFDIFYDKEVFQKIIVKSKSLEGYGNINEFLKEILEKRGLEVVDRIKKLIKLQVDTNKGLFHAHAFTHLEDLLVILYDKYDGKNCKICNMIFEKGLESGHKSYIEIYEKYYKNEE